jgi:heme exporter protein B
MWRDARLVMGKDLRIEMRSRVSLNQVLPFALAVLVLFGLALGPNLHVLAAETAGLVWMAVLFSCVLGVQRSYSIESSDAARDGLRLSGLDPAGIFLGKAAALALQLFVLEIVLALVASVLYGTALSEALVLAVTCVVATLGLSAVGTLYGALALGVRVRETLLPLLFFPVVAPVLMGAMKAWQAGLAGTPGKAAGWLELLAVFAVAYGAIGTIAFGPLLEDG